jgi:hypothetical protein
MLFFIVFEYTRIVQYKYFCGSVFKLRLYKA